MRIAYLCADAGVPVFGPKGCSIHVQETIRAMRSEGLDVEVFAVRRGGEAPADLTPIRVHEIPISENRDPETREQLLLAANPRFDELLEEQGPFDLVYERYSLWSYAAVDYAGRSGIPCVLEVNSPLLEEQSLHRTLMNREVAAKVAERVFQGAHTVIAVSEAVGDYLRRFPGTDRRVMVLPNGVDPERFNPHQPPLDRRRDCFTVGFVGSLKPWHDLDTLVDGFADFHSDFPGSRLLVVGDGPERENVLRRARHRGVGDSIMLTGAVKPADVPRWLTSMDVGVVPYRAGEDCYFSPMKLYEYLASGLPTLASDVGQIPSVIQHRFNGLLYPAGDSAGLCAALRTVATEPVLTRRLGENGRETILTGGHTWGDNVRRILSRARLPIPALSKAEVS